MSTPTTLQRMDEHIAIWEQTDDKRHVFLRCYRMMTANMLSSLAQPGTFEDEEWVKRLLHHFADYYFNALACIDCGEEAPVVWQQVYNFTRGKALHQVQYLLLGVNAHINYDLVLALHDMLRPEWADLSDQQRKVRYRDHCTVNDIIGATIDRVQDELLEPADPMLAFIDRAFGRLDEYLLSRLITHWRQEVWETTQVMLAQKEEHILEALRQNLESDVCRRAKLLAL